MPSITILFLSDGVDALPSYATSGASGVDICAHIPASLYVLPHQTVLVPTGLRIAIPSGYEVQIRPRSGLAARSGMLLPNAPGTIDSDYRGELKILMRNTASSICIIRPGDRVAQMVCAQSRRIRWRRRRVLPNSKRGAGGLGSTGM